MFIFNYNYNLIDFQDIIEIKKKFKLKKLNILDFGCGLASWEKKHLNNKIINKIFLYDNNKKLISLLKKKYKHKKIILNFNKKKIFKKNINLIILSSVIQYMSKKELISLFSEIRKKYNNKKIYIFINDYPVIVRYLELLLLPFINWEKLIASFYLIFNRQYLKTKYYKHQLLKDDYIKKNFKIKNLGYVKNMKFLRIKLIMKIKNN